jgi:hypothetical protein
MFVNWVSFFWQGHQLMPENSAVSPQCVKGISLCGARLPYRHHSDGAHTRACILG